MDSLAGRTALITGAGTGIGKGVALTLARQGAQVVCHYASSKSGAEETVAEITRLGGSAVALHGDLQYASECKALVEAAVNALGSLDILVNNAGVTRAVSFCETSEESFDEMFDLNMKGHFFCAKHAVDHMVKQGRGSIVNMTSVHAHAGFPYHTAYAATKGAIIAFTKALAIELAPHAIRVNAIGPGIIEVPRYYSVPGYTREFGNRLVPWGRVGTPADIGSSVAFLASDAADFITGQILYVDGGTSARMGLWWEQEPAEET